MNISRFNAVKEAQGREEYQKEAPTKKISDYFGENVFTVQTMKKYLSEKAYQSVLASIQSGNKINREVADQVAAAMKAWAMGKGATHYTHWFQPLTGMTAEKHDSFFTLSSSGEAIEEFTSVTLVQQEPDASSFPNGGLRSTFEARGYTAWDPSSPAFLMEIGTGKTLCIPTIFVSYTGFSLDYKAPLLKSQQYLEQAAVPVCQYFDRNVTHVTPTLGWEQEYFLVDEALFESRPDLMLCGRTLLGKKSTKGQQLDDHYFGSIPERIYAYMRDLEEECHKLGIPVRTRHNEVGPGQYELAPMYEEVNVAVDHNQLLMDLMDRIARRHKLRVLLHEKPFAGVNGSGKHNNWSMATNTGKNLLSPGKTPRKNLRFLTFFVNTIKAVADHADLLRASIASASNDHRLGANEAPPAIVSVFIGKTLSEVLDDLAARTEDWFTNEDKKAELKLDIHNKIPDLLLDNTDRNRTSPFAFTGNKFEIRMVGSSMNCASPMTVMNTIVGTQLKKFREEVDALVKDKNFKKDTAILTVIQRLIRESRAILFEGDNYSDAWKNEAKTRGLNNLGNTATSLDAYVSKSSIKVFEDSGVMSKDELEAHYETKVENYILKLQIESRTLGELCVNQVLPASIRYQNMLLENVSKMKDLGLSKDMYSAQLELLSKTSANISKVNELVSLMTEKRRAANELEDSREMSLSYRANIFPLIEELRIYVDRLEYLVEDQYWPMVKYRELMFIK